MTNIKETLSQYKELKKRLETEIKEGGEVMLKELFKEIFDKHEGLKVVAFIGYTPSFNDGEPCIHDQAAYVGKYTSYSSDPSKGYFDFEDYTTREELYEAFGYNKEAEVKTCVNSGCKTLKEACTEVDVCSEIIEQIYSTNFLVVIKRQENGDVTIDPDDYDCGH